MSEDILDWVSHLPKIENYTSDDQYHDFRKVFMGTTEGQRVLRRILELGSIFHQPALQSPVDPYMLAAFHGRRFLALKVLSIVNNEPPKRPAKAKRREVKHG